MPKQYFKWKNRITFAADHAILTITKKRQAETVVYRVIIDSNDAERVSKLHWRLDPKGYAAHWSGGRHGDKKYSETFFFLHRWLMNAPEGTFVDHLNHDLLDNRKSNLGVCDSHSCVFQNSLVANRGVKVVTYNKITYVVVETPNGWQAVGKCNDRAEAKRVASQIRFGEKSFVDCLTDYETNKKYRSTNHHIRLIDGRYFRVNFRGYRGCYPTFAEAKEVRNKAIREWCEKQFEETK